MPDLKEQIVELSIRHNADYPNEFAIKIMELVRQAGYVQIPDGCRLTCRPLEDN